MELSTRIESIQRRSRFVTDAHFWGPSWRPSSHGESAPHLTEKWWDQDGDSHKAIPINLPWMTHAYRLLSVQATRRLRKCFTALHRGVTRSTMIK